MAVKIAWPRARVTLMEPLERKFKFLNSSAARLGVKDLRVLKKAAGPGVGGDFDCVMERALAPLPEAVALALPLVKEGGFFLAYQSEAPDCELPALKKALAKAAARFVESLPYRLPKESKERHLAAFQKMQGE